METKSKKLFLGYIAIIYGFFLLCILVNNFCGRTEEHWRFFYAFTQQSNIISLIWMLTFGFSAFLSPKLYRITTNNTLMTAVTVYMSITFFIVLFILDPVFKGAWNPFKSASELILHDLTPIMMWLFYFLVKGNGTLKYRNALFILIYPILFLGANLYIGTHFDYLNGKPAFAYDFINIYNYNGLAPFAGLILTLIIIFALFGIILMRFKQYLEKEIY